MPTKTDPATVPLLTDADVEREFNATEDPDRLYVERLDAYPNGFGERMRTFAARIYALAASRVDTAEVERRAARKALAECAAWLGKGESQPVRFDEDGRFLLAFERVNAFSDRYIAREYPAPAPRECVLSDGSVVIVDVEATKRDTINTPCLRRGNHTVLVGDWIRLLITAHDTGADFDALKRFAAEVGR
jgi:hypothetical protein